MRVLYKNLKGIFTGEGFEKKNGRKILPEDTTYLNGPIHILVDEDSKKILKISSEDLSADREEDCHGLVATAAFVDSHTHALFGGSRWNEFFMRWGGADYAAINTSGGGIRKTFRDTRMCSDEELEEKLLEDIRRMSAEGTRVFEVKSGYGENINEELRTLRIVKKVKAESECEIVSTFLGLHAIPQHIDEEAWVKDATKILSQIKEEHLAEFVDSFPEKGFFSLESSKSFSEAALKMGFKVKIHADEITHVGATELGAKLGATSVDHLQKISDEALALLGSSKTIATLLPATSFYIGIPYAPARKILDSGARVALATDYNPGTAPNSSMLFTAMLAASQMKMTPSEIFCALTYNAAGALARDHLYGLVKEGYSSQILFWEVKTENALEEILLSGTKPLPLL